MATSIAIWSGSWNGPIRRPLPTYWNLQLVCFGFHGNWRSEDIVRCCVKWKRKYAAYGHLRTLAQHVDLGVSEMASAFRRSAAGRRSRRGKSSLIAEAGNGASNTFLMDPDLAAPTAPKWTASATWWFSIAKLLLEPERLETLLRQRGNIARHWANQEAYVCSPKPTRSTTLPILHEISRKARPERCWVLA